MADFNDFWEIYPRKTAKVVARRAWEKLNPDYTLLEKMRANIEARILAGEWREKQFIPHPATYLNQERWEDEVIAPNQSLSNSTRDRTLEQDLNDRSWAG